VLCRRDQLNMGSVNKPNVMVDWLKLLRIREVLGSSLGRRTCILMFFRIFLHFNQANAGTYLKLGHDRFLPYPFRFITVVIRSFDGI
jgi:hypothetical protein